MMENGEWRMENGEWRMENGEWRMENGVFNIGSDCVSGTRRLSFSILHSSFLFSLFCSAK
jgi:hypothetical protein